MREREISDRIKQANLAAKKEEKYMSKFIAPTSPEITRREIRRQPV